MSISWGEFGNRLIANAKQERLPLIAQFELTSRCNLSCKMCYVCNLKNQSGLIKQEKTAKEWISLAKEAKNAGVLYLLLTGGEVFLRPDFKEIYKAISEMGFILEVYSNATLITPEIAEWLGKRPPAKMGVSMYGASSDTYERITGNANAYDKFVNGVDLLLENNINLNIRTTIVKGNVKDVGKMFEFAKSRNIMMGTTAYITPRREGTDSDPIGERMTPKEMMEFGQYFKENILSQNPISDDKKNYNKSIEEIVEKITNAHENSAFSCSAGHCSFWVTWDGRMTPCGLMSEPKVDVFKKGIINAWDELKTLCDEIPKCMDCQDCKYINKCSVCAAKLKTETGKYDKCADYLKKIAVLANK